MAVDPSNILKALSKQQKKTEKAEQEEELEISKPTDGFESNKKKREALQKVLKKLREMNSES